MISYPPSAHHPSTYPLPLPHTHPTCERGFPGGSDSRECLQCWRPGFNPCFGKTPWRREWLPTAVFVPGEFSERRILRPWAFSICPLGEGGLGALCASLPAAAISIPDMWSCSSSSESSKDPLVFSSKEHFDVLNDKAGHHGDCVEIAPCRHAGRGSCLAVSTSGRLKCFVSALCGRLCCQSCPCVAALGSLGKHGAAGPAQYLWQDRAWICSRKQEPHSVTRLSPLPHPGCSGHQGGGAFASRTFTYSGSNPSLWASVSFLICEIGMIMIIPTLEDGLAHIHPGEALANFQ